jgi:hypothetical protein
LVAITGLTLRRKADPAIPALRPSSKAMSREP